MSVRNIDKQLITLFKNSLTPSALRTPTNISSGVARGIQCNFWWLEVASRKVPKSIANLTWAGVTKNVAILGVQWHTPCSFGGLLLLYLRRRHHLCPFSILPLYNVFKPNTPCTKIPYCSREGLFRPGATATAALKQPNNYGEHEQNIGCMNLGSVSIRSALRSPVFANQEMV